MNVISPVRRVITANNAAGKSYVLKDEEVRPGEISHDLRLWVSNEVPASNDGPVNLDFGPHRLEPPTGGTVFRFVQFPPQSALAGLTDEQVAAFTKDLFAAMGASHAQVDTSRSPAMHKTRTLDYVVVLSGELTLVLDEGEVVLKPMDVVVQRGTNHDWVNRGDVPAVIAVVMVDAKAS